MSDIIHLLPDSVANQIAAGEVIQRPASVLKELVENSIDAGAKKIQVLIKDAGKESIQVIDDGVGMSSTDARLSFERHATSKIRSAADLYELKTMGFRGEALASIAAIAQVELKTRREEDELGTLIQLSGSNVEKQEMVVAPVGTTFTIKNLFFNVPARRKFLKGNDVELRHIIAEFERIVLVHPETAFVLSHNNTELFNLPVSNMRQRILNIFKTSSNSFNQQLISLHTETSLVSIEGFIGSPECARKKNAVQYFFVNGRYMRHPYFHKAVMSCYEQLIPSGEMPNYFLYLTVDPSTIDINVHPTKTEIKFENEAVIWKIIAAAVKEALGKANVVPSIDFDQDNAPDIPVLEPGMEIRPPQVEFNTNYNPFNTNTSPSGKGSYNSNYTQRSLPDWEQLYKGFEKKDAEEIVIHDFSGYEETPLYKQPQEDNHLFGSVEINDQPQFLTFKGKYLVTSVKSGLMIIDQHRAHIRVLHDQYLNNIKQKQGASQRILFPERMELTVSESIFLKEIWDDLHFIGFDIGDLGSHSYSINAVPSGTEGLDPVEMIRDMIFTAMEKGNDLKEEVAELVSLSLARSAAIKYGQNLSAEEIQALIGNLFRSSTPNYTPDGKSVLSIISNEDLDKYFK